VAEEEYGKYGKLKLKEGELLVRKGVLKFPASPEDRPLLIGGKCKLCGDISFPPRHFCPMCGAETEEFPFGSFAEVVTYTVVRQDTMGIKAPYIMAMVNFPDLNDPELAVITQIADCPIEDIRIGMKVELIIGKVRSTMMGAMMERFGMPSDSIIGYKYRPIKEAN